MERKAKGDFGPGAIVGLTFLFMGAVYLLNSLFLLGEQADAEAVAVRSVFLPLGAVFLIAGCVLTVRFFRKKRMADQLLEEGRYVWGTVVDLRQIRTINGFRGHPWVALVHYTKPDGTVRQFQSRHMYRPLQPSLLGKQVRVYVSGSQKDVYYVDMESLLPRKNTY